MLENLKVERSVQYMVKEVVGRVRLLSVVTFSKRGNVIRSTDSKGNTVTVAKPKVIGYVVRNEGTGILVAKHAIGDKVATENVQSGKSTVLSIESLYKFNSYYSKLEYTNCRFEQSINGRLSVLIPIDKKSEIIKTDCAIYENGSDIPVGMKPEFVKYFGEEFVRDEIDIYKRRELTRQIRSSGLYLAKVIKYKCNGDPAKGKVMMYALMNRSNQNMSVVGYVDGVPTQLMIEPRDYLYLDKKYLLNFYKNGGNIVNAICVNGDSVEAYLKFKNSNGTNFTVNDDNKVIDLARNRIFTGTIFRFLSPEHASEVMSIMRNNR